MPLQDPRWRPSGWSQKGSPFGEDGGHTFFLFPLSHPYNQPASSPCWKRPGSSPPWPSQGWSTTSLEPGRRSLGSPFLHIPPRPKAFIQSTYRGSCSPTSCSGGNQFVWSLYPETAAIGTLGFQGVPASPLCHVPYYEGTCSGGRGPCGPWGSRPDSNSQGSVLGCGRGWAWQHGLTKMPGLGWVAWPDTFQNASYQAHLIIQKLKRPLWSRW